MKLNGGNNSKELLLNKFNFEKLIPEILIMIW